MEEIARWDGLDLGQCYAYSDSASDLPMLQAVGHPVAVNPDARLARHARAYGWPIVHFSQRTKSVIRRSFGGHRGDRDRGRQLRRRHRLRQASVDRRDVVSGRRHPNPSACSAGPSVASKRSVSRFYVTTPIYYVNAEPHLGHAYTTIVGDALARWHRLLGDDVNFLTGTDEHGLKIQQAAEAAGMSPQEFADAIAPLFQRGVAARSNISNDDFIRTTEPRHTSASQELLQRCYDAGDIELDIYERQVLRRLRGVLHRRRAARRRPVPDPQAAGRVLRGGELLLPPRRASRTGCSTGTPRTPARSCPSSAATRRSG